MTWPRLIPTLLAGCLAAEAARPSSDWTAAVQSLAPGTRIEVVPLDHRKYRLKGEIIRVDAAAVALATGSGEVSIARSAVEAVKVSAPERKSRNGLIGVAIGAAGGLGTAFAICPYCGNEGRGGAFYAVLVAIGAGLGATAFAFTPYRTVYRAPKR